MKDRIDWSSRRKDYVSIYISKEEMDREFYKSKMSGVWTNRAGELIITLVENIIFSRRFKLDNSKFIITESLIDYVILFILEEGMRLYNPQKTGSAFSYFSRVVYTKGMGFLRDRFGEKKRLDLYGQNLKFKGDDGDWYSMELINKDE